MNHLIKYVITTLLCSGVAVFAQSAITWSDPVTVMPSSAGNYHPRIAVDAAGNPLIMWGHSGTNRVLFTRWNGSAFTQQVVLNPSSMPSFYEDWAGPDMAARGDTVYVVFKQTPEDKNRIYCLRSIDGGKTFGMPVAVDNIADSISRFPAVAIDAAGNPLVAFMKFNSDFTKSRWVVARSIDGGKSFLKDVLASGYSGGTVCDCCPGTLTTSGSTIAMLYRDNDTNIRDTWVGVSNDDGQTFAQGMAVDKNNWLISACPASGPDGVILGDTLYSSFMSSATGKGFIYHNHSSISSLESSKAPASARGIGGLISQNYPRIAAEGNAVAEVWQQAINSATQVAMLFSPNVHNGFATTPEIVASAPAGAIVNADVAVHNGTVYVVYQDNNSGTVRMRRGSYTLSDVNEVASENQALQITKQQVVNGRLDMQLNLVPDSPLLCTVSNILGQRLFSSELNSSDTNVTCNLPTLATGVLMIHLQSSKGNCSALVVAE